MPFAAPEFRDLLNEKMSDEEAQARVVEYCRIDLANIEDTLAKHPGLFAYAVAVHEMAEVNEAQLRWEYENSLSRAFEILVDQKPKGDKIVVSDIEKRAKLTPLVSDAWKEYIKARKITSRFKALMKGYDTRGQMLVQISSKRKAESYNGV